MTIAIRTYAPPPSHLLETPIRGYEYEEGRSGGVQSRRLLVVMRSF